MCENAYLSIKNPKASRALKRALDPGRRMLASLVRLRFAMSATFGLRSWGPPLTKSWIRTCTMATVSLHVKNTTVKHISLDDGNDGEYLDDDEESDYSYDYGDDGDDNDYGEQDYVDIQFDADDEY